MWFETANVYQIYPLGLCGTPEYNHEEGQAHRLGRIEGWIPHIQALNMDTVLFNPLFESDKHGYDTRDYYKVDRRLGTNEEFADLCQKLHAAGIKVMLDGVFNHVGRGFWAFRDVQEKKWDSAYKDWFHLSFEGNTEYNDGFWYEGWEGHNELVKLNLQNPQVVEHLFSAIRSWVELYDIDGLRLDVAYCLPGDFLEKLRRFTESLKPDFVLMGETLHGDYNRWMNQNACHAVTNYECYKGLHSSFNSMNMFEIGHSLARQYGPEPWTLYKGAHLLAFLDNHDVERIASILNDKNQLYPAWGLLFGMPGTPAVYYGSEWGMEGRKQDGDAALRPEVETPVDNELTDWIRTLAKARKDSRALCFGSYRNVVLTNKQIIFERAVEGERVLVAVNACHEAYTAHFDAGCGTALELITGKTHDFGGGSVLPPYSVQYWRMER